MLVSFEGVREGVSESVSEWVGWRICLKLEMVVKDVKLHIYMASLQGSMALISSRRTHWGASAAKRAETVCTLDREQLVHSHEPAED